MPIFLLQNHLTKNRCDEKARTCIFPFHPQPYQVLKNLTSNISPLFTSLLHVWLFLHSPLKSAAFQV